MITLITGGVKNGKSKFGEDYCVKHSGDKCYIATMFRDESDDETTKRIERHREMRLGKGFITFEKYFELNELKLSGFDTALLECISNLLANEIYMNSKAGKDAEDAVLEGIKAISLLVSNLVIITNDVSSDGILYEQETEEYQQILSSVNKSLAMLANEVYEVVCGIPIRLK